MASIFGGNPFATPVGQLIDKATDASLPSENWGLNMEICDVINETEDGPKDGMKAIRKKLSLNVGKNYTVVMYTLTILETCVKNCGKRFHLLVAHKDFLQELIKIIGPKNDPPQVVQEKILSLIQTWADAFRGAPDLKEVNKVYQDLKNKGIEFPMTDLDSLAPIHTPARTAPEPEPAPPLPARNPTVRQGTHQSPQHQSPQQQSPQHQVAAPTGPVTVNQDQMTKLHSEMEVVKGNIRVFGEMLTELKPNTAAPADLELLQELNDTCRQMQQRIVQLLEQVSNEEVTGELLHVNDDLNNIFLRYDRFERYRTGQTGQEAPAPAPAAVSTGPPPYSATTPAAMPSLAPPPAVSRNPPSTESTPTANLIDFGDPPSTVTAGQTQNPVAAASLSDVNVQLASMNVGGATSVSSQLGQLSSTTATNTASANHDEFDMFAQSRQSFDTSKQAAGGNVYANQQGDQFSGGLGAAVNAKSTVYTQNIKDKEQDLDEMERWMEENSKNGAAAQKPQKEEHVTSAGSDFSFIFSL